MTDRTPTTEAEPDVRHVKMYRDLWDPVMPGIMLRSWDGRAIGIDWGEPDAEGWYSPTFRVSGTTEAERLDEARAPLVAARLVGRHWLDAIMASDTLRGTGMSHPIAMMLAALDGETDPRELGISEDQYDAFRAALSRENQP